MLPSGASSPAGVARRHERRALDWEVGLHSQTGPGGLQLVPQQGACRRRPVRAALPLGRQEDPPARGGGLRPEPRGDRGARLAAGALGGVARASPPRWQAPCPPPGRGRAGATGARRDWRAPRLERLVLLCGLRSATRPLGLRLPPRRPRLCVRRRIHWLRVLSGDPVTDVGVRQSSAR